MCTGKIKEVIKCDFCNEKALYDARTRFGYWAYLCQSDFKKYGVGLGIGKGQILTKREA